MSVNKEYSRLEKMKIIKSNVKRNKNIGERTKIVLNHPYGLQARIEKLKESFERKMKY